MSLPAKRSPSPLPRHLDDIIRIRLADDKKKSRLSTVAPQDGPPATTGQEVLSLFPSLQHDLKHENINDLILGTTNRLAREGKRLIRAPRLLPDGIAFDWTYDMTARNENIRSLLSVEGIRAQDLERVLLRSTPASTGISRAATEEPRSLIPANSLHMPSGTTSRDTFALLRQLRAGSASNPIVVDDDNDQEQRNAGASHSPSRRPTNEDSRNTDLSPIGTHLPEHHLPSPSDDVEVHLHSSSGDKEDSQLTENLGIHGPKAPSEPTRTRSHDRSSVVSCAPRRPNSSAFGNHIQDRNGGLVDGSASQNEDDVPDLRTVGSSPFRGLRKGSGSQASPEVGTRRADYGEWKSFAEDSSDVEMDEGCPSSRDPSPTRTFPPQPPGRPVPGLPFLPQTYDHSGLLSLHASVSASGSIRSGTSAGNNERSGPSSRRRPESPRRRPYQSPNRPVELSSDRAGTVRLFRRRPVQGVRPNTPRSSDHSKEDSDVDSRNKVRMPIVSLPRMGTSSRNLRESQSAGSARAPQVEQRASVGHRRPRSVRRSASASSRDAESDPENEVDREPLASPKLGHTVVIPKADFARGRRLLTPTNPDHPMVTILMRGEAHFIDQRRKTRVSSYSLPVEDDARHVEDACLISDDKVVVGYNKGPCQVSLIPVEGHQRPYRIDLTYKAHSMVIENRAAGKSYPNRGIACLAPVAGDSFLSGGHDKMVYHWKLARANGRKKDRGDFSVRSVRIPTEHSQSVQALAYSAWDDTVYSAAGDRIATTKLTALAHAEPERVSGKITQVHVHPQDPRLIAVEIDHMDYQVHFYDMREGGFSRKPWLEFGYRSAPPRANRASANTSAGTGAGQTNASASASSSSLPKLGSRYTRGSTTNSLFARGYGDGVVLVWDYRNGAQKKVLERFQFQRPAEVAHTVLTGSDVIAYGGYSVTFWSTLDANR